MEEITLTKQQLVDATLSSFNSEKEQDIESNKKLLHSEFAMADMILDKDDHPFPRVSGTSLHKLINQAFQINDREYIFKTIVADESIQTVFVEFVESYQNKSVGKIHTSPQVTICQFKNGKLYRTRHYMDPRVPHEYIALDTINAALS